MVGLPYGLAATPLYERGVELKPPDDEGSPTAPYFGPGGTSFRVLRQPEDATVAPNVIASAPPARTRLSRSIDMTSSFPGAGRPPAPRRTIVKSAPVGVMESAGAPRMPIHDIAAARPG
jgi:hypothetical protein